MKSNLSKNAQLFRKQIARLKSEVSGNVLPMMGAAIIPLTAMIGGGIEASRIYMAKTRLQQACDAGALAGRKVMAAGTFTSASANANGGLDAKGQAEAYFKSNFAEGTFGAVNISANYVEVDKQVEGSASATLPLMIMKLFGFNDMNISTTCKAELSLSNTDVMFVLDTTGSMASKATGSDPKNKIDSLRDAVVDFYDEMAKSLPANAQLRYGFVPYSTNVNVGKILYAKNPAWIESDKWTYQSRQYFAENITGVSTPATWENPSATVFQTTSQTSVDRNMTWTDVSGVSALFGATTLANPYAAATTQTACQSVNGGSVYTGTATPNGAAVDTNGASTVDSTTGVKTTPVVRTQNYVRTDYQYYWKITTGGGTGSTTVYAYTNPISMISKLDDLGLYGDNFQTNQSWMSTIAIYPFNGSNEVFLKYGNWMLNKRGTLGNNSTTNNNAILSIMNNYIVNNNITYTSNRRLYYDPTKMTDVHRTNIISQINQYIDSHPVPSSASTGSCVLQKRTPTYDVTTNGSFTQQPLTWNDPVGTPEKWVYKPMDYSLGSYVTGATVNVGTGTDGAMVATTWEGCVEERKTVATGDFTTVPSDAYDLNINKIPDSKDTRWKPYWPEVEYARPNVAATEYYRNKSGRGNGTFWGNVNWPDLPAEIKDFCPAQAKKLAVMDRSAVQTYVDSLVAGGNTYHDLGIIWGARLLSPSGLFASENATTQYGEPISRHLIFMTDGELMPNTSIYSAYGSENLDQRVTGGTLSTQWNRHNERFKAACREANKLGMTIWAVGFGVTVPDSMYTCASDDPTKKAAAVRTFQADDAAELKTQFRKIASEIAQLRLGA
jgi:Flp pilus assembly protein TadG